MEYPKVLYWAPNNAITSCPTPFKHIGISRTTKPLQMTPLCMKASEVRYFWPGIMTVVGTLASEVRERRPPLLKRSQSSVMCFFRRDVSFGMVSGPVLKLMAWSLGLRDRHVFKRWETAASTLSSQPWKTYTNWALQIQEFTSWKWINKVLFESFVLWLMWSVKFMIFTLSH